jgi:tripartite-type tricarboxylate transporter receptor subunit TctC
LWLSWHQQVHSLLPITERLAKEINTILLNADVNDRLKKYGFRVVAGGPEVLRSRIQREVPMWKEIIEKAKVVDGLIDLCN